MVSGQLSQLAKVVQKNHVLHKYSGKNELIKDAIPFFREGLSNNESVMIITNQFTQEEFVNVLKLHFGEKIDDLVLKNKIIYKNTKEWYFPNGTVDVLRIISNWKKVVNSCIENGSSGLWVFADMGEFFENNLVSEVIVYESALTPQFDFPFTAVCAYPQESLSSLTKDQRVELLEHHGIHSAGSNTSIMCECGVSFPSDYSECPSCKKLVDSVLS